MKLKNKKILKSAVLMLLILLLLFGTVGCKKQPSTVDKMLAYMHEKYDDNFTYVDSFDGGLDKETKWIMVKSEKHPDWDVRVYYSAWGGDEKITDNYICCKYKKQAYEKFENMLESVFECDVKIDPMFSVTERKDAKTGKRSDFNSSTTFEEFINSPYVRIYGNAMISPEFELKDKNNLENKLKTFIEKENLIINSFIIFPKNSYLFEQGFDLKAYEQKGIEQLHIIMYEHNEYEKIEWSNVQ